MSTSNQDTGAPLPHAALLTYFRNPAAPPNSPIPKVQDPPPYNDCAESHQSLATEIRIVDAEEDVESNCGFRGERNPSHDAEPKFLGFRSLFHGKRNRKGCYAFCCFWCAVSICIMAAFGIFFVIDLGFSQYEMGTGMAEWMLHGHARRSVPQHEMRFCLATTNREAPGPQRWHYLQPKTYDDCTTEIVTLFANPTEQWKINADAEILMGTVAHPDNRDEEYQRFSSPNGELGDDVAEEGRLWQ